MNTNQLISMVLRLFARKAMTKGLNEGVRRMSSRPGSGSDSPGDANQTTQRTKSQARNLDQAMKVTRRLMRF